METDTLTQAEKEWLSKLETILDKQPKNLRIMVHSTFVSACRPHDVHAYFEEHGDIDNVSDLWSFHHGGRLQPCSESI